ncbi:MAG: heavy metal transport/detoxification protein [Acidobacteriaceae bacterium]|nr:heavy metal transport/detoxification protein [Acidobacteriaceae bacterium]
MELQIEKMSCGACIRRVTQTLNSQPDTHAEEVRLGSARVTSAQPAEELLRALGEAGFPAHVTEA